MRPRRPSRPPLGRPRPRRRRVPAAPIRDPWSLGALVAELEGRVRAHAAAHPAEPPEAWLYEVLDSWAADRHDRWRRERAGRGLPVVREPACRPGCDHCCHQHVLVTGIEAEILARHVRERWAGAEVAALGDRLRAGADRLRRIEADAASPEASRAAIARDRLPCPMLDEAAGRCRAYEARPVNCRRENSLDPEVCRRYRLDPEAGDSSLRLVRFDLIWGAARVFLARRAAGAIESDPDPGPDPDDPLPLVVALARRFA